MCFIPLKEITQYVADHPLVLLVLAIILLIIIITIIKKLAKIALVLILVFVVANALVIYFADKEWAQKGKEFIEQNTKRVEKLVKTEGEKLFKKSMNSIFDSSDQKDSVIPIKKVKRK